MQKTTPKRKPHNIEKDSYRYRLSHEAALLFREMAREQGIEPSAFLEIISRELAQERLSEEQRSSVKQEAARITAQRKQAASQAAT
jgi:hypothetical protein